MKRKKKGLAIEKKRKNKQTKGLKHFLPSFRDTMKSLKRYRKYLE